jgi:drug/metabolite transporter (DMT)-like permease
MSKKTPLAIGAWLVIITVFWTIAFIIAMSIPTFNDLLSLISSLFASWFTYGLAGVLWLYLHRGGAWKKKPFLAVLNVFLVLMGVGIMGMGLYASGTAIKADSGSSKSWSCADNSKPKS